MPAKRRGTSKDKPSDYPHLVAEWSSKNKRTMDDYTAGTHEKAWWKCKCGHEWEARLCHRTEKRNPTGCPKCSGKHRRQDKLSDYPKLIAEWSPKNAESISNYSTGSGYKAWWQCEYGHEWQRSIYARTRRHSGCPYCPRFKYPTNVPETIAESVGDVNEVNGVNHNLLYCPEQPFLLDYLLQHYLV